MSEYNHVIRITPPLLIGPGNKQETILSPGHMCTFCHGNGSFWSEMGHTGEGKKICPVCNGSGELYATIRIEWNPGIGK